MKNRQTGNEIRSIAVTGINGMIGRHTAAALAKAGYRVFGLSEEAACAAGIPAEGYMQADITDPQQMERFFTQYPTDAVVHLAALVHGKGAGAPESEFMRVNDAGSRNVFMSAKKHGSKHILFASTVEVYGDTDAQAVGEDAPCSPISPYGRSKLAAEQALLALPGVRHAVMRFAPVYAEDFMLNIKKRIYLRPGRLAYYFKDGAYTFDFCAVHNITAFITEWLVRGESGVFNLSDGHPYSAKQMIAMEREAGRAAHVLRLPYYPAKAGIWMIETVKKLTGRYRQDSFFSLYNFGKLFASRRWAAARAHALIGSGAADMRRALYDKTDTRGGNG